MENNAKQIKELRAEIIVEIFGELAKSIYTYDRETAAGSRHTPPEILTELAKDG